MTDDMAAFTPMSSLHARGAREFEPLRDSLLQEIAARGGVRHYPAQALLVSEDERGDSLFIILRGRVKVYGAGPDGREIVYGTQGPGEYFGELTLDGGPRSASVISLEPCTCAVVPGAEVRDFLATHPDFALHLVLKLIHRLRASTDQVKSLALDDVYSRIARLLLRLAEPGEGLPEGAMLVPEKLTQQDLAERVGASREMVSRILKALTDGGWLEMRAGRIVVLKKLPPRW